MTVDDIVAALALPRESRVDQRVSKKLLIENGAPTSSDRKKIQEGIEELRWMAAVKPTNSGVPAYRDADREVLEIAVVTLALRPEGESSRLARLVHRAIPYPVLLIATMKDSLGISVARKRLSQNEGGKVVLEANVVSCDLTDNPSTPAFVQSLALAMQPRGSLLSVYDGWQACLEAFQAAQITGRYVVAPSVESANLRRESLARHEQSRRKIARLRAAALRESQLNRRVELNLAIRKLEAELAETRVDL